MDEARARLTADAATEYARSRLTSAMLGRVDELRSQASQAANTQAARNRVNRLDVQSLFRQSDPCVPHQERPHE